MINHTDIKVVTLRKLYRQGAITVAGNRVLKIYGTLTCSSGKRMKKMNRVFFTTDIEAIKNGTDLAHDAFVLPIVTGRLRKKRVERFTSQHDIWAFDDNRCTLHDGDDKRRTH